MKNTLFKMIVLAAQIGVANTAVALDAFTLGNQAYKRGDFEVARQTWLQATAPVDPKVSINLGSLYFFGKGVVSNHATAFQWYLKSARAGDNNAQLLVGRMYAEGDGIQHDKVLADAWLNIANANGNPDAGPMIAALEKTMQDWELRQAAQIFNQCKLVSFTNCSI